MALLTAVSVIATILILLAMAHTNAIARRSMIQVSELEAQRLRPYLLFDFKFTKAKNKDFYFVFACLKNVGKTPAVHARIEIDPLPHYTPIIGGKEVKKTPSFLTDEISFIAPSQAITDFLGDATRLFETFSPPLFQGTVRYANLNGRKYSEPFVLNLAYLRNAVPMDDTDADA